MVSNFFGRTEAEVEEIIRSIMAGEPPKETRPEPVRGWTLEDWLATVEEDVRCLEELGIIKLQ